MALPLYQSEDILGLYNEKIDVKNPKSAKIPRNLRAVKCTECDTSKNTICQQNRNIAANSKQIISIKFPGWLNVVEENS